MGQQVIERANRKSRLFPELQEVSHGRSMMSMEAVKGALDRDEDGVVALIGTWLIGWDIASPGSARREWRILTRSVSVAAKSLDTKKHPPQWIWNEVLGLVLLRLLTDQPGVTGVDIQHSLNCSSTHVMRLIQCEALKLLPGSTYGKGRGHSPFVTRESFADFLCARLEDSRNIIALPSGSADARVTPPAGTLLNNEGIQINKPTRYHEQTTETGTMHH